jgi:RNA polymerase sigma-70 factor (ECF subfamily)
MIFNNTEIVKNGIDKNRVLISSIPVQETSSSYEFSQMILDELPFLRRIVHRWHRFGADAEDLVQDTVVRALANSQQWEPGTNLRAWLFTIMRNRFLGEKASSFRTDVAMRGHPNLDHKPAMLERQDARLLLRDAQRVIERLPKVQRTALLLVGAEGRSHDAVAKTLGISVGALRCHLTRARARLRKAIYDVQLTSPLAPRHTTLPGGRRAGLQLRSVEQRVDN